MVEKALADDSKLLAEIVEKLKVNDATLASTPILNTMSQKEKVNFILTYSLSMIGSETTLSVMQKIDNAKRPDPYKERAQVSEDIVL